MTDKDKKEEVVQAYPVNYIIPTHEDEIDLLDLWRAFIAQKKYFIISLVIALVMGIVGVANTYQPKYSVSSKVDIGSMRANGQGIPGSFVNTFVEKIKAEITPLVLSDSFFDQTRVLVSGTSVSLKKQTSLIDISNKVLPEGKDAAVEFHRRLATAVMEDLHNSYRLFNSNENNALLSIKRQLNNLERDLRRQEDAKSGGKPIIIDEGFLNREIEILEQRAANFEAALEVARPRVISVADVSSSPVGVSQKYSVSSMVDIGSMKANGESIPRSFVNTLIAKIKAEKTPLVLSDSFFDQTKALVSGTSVSLKKNTYLIGISNKVLPEGRDAAVEFHRRLATTVMEDLHNSYRLFNFKVDNALLSTKKQLIKLEGDLQRQEDAKSGEKPRIIDEGFLNREIEILEQRAANFEAALEVARPRVISVADVSSSPVGTSPKQAYLLVVILSLFFAFAMVILVIFIQKIRQRLAEEDLP